MTDTTLQRSFKGLLIVVIGMLLLAAAILLASRLWPLSLAQQRSLAALHATAQDSPGRNAHTTLATLDLEGLTPAQRQARVDAFIPRYARWQSTYLERSVKENSKSDTENAPTLAAAGDRKLTFDTRLCSFNDAPACLDKVRKQPAPVAEALIAQQDLLERISDLPNYGHYRLPPAISPGIGASLPSARLLATPLAAHAYAYLQGDAHAAMTGLCRDASSARMLMAHSDNLLLVVSGGKMLTANTQVLATILAELPAGTALPGNCDSAFAALSNMEMSTCSAMRGEFEGFTALSSNNTREFSKARALLFFNEGKTNARQAETMAWPCLPEHQQLIASDRILPPPPYPPLWRLECAANYVGCILSSIAAPSYQEYVAVQQDAGAYLRLLQAVLWLREHAEDGTGATLAKRVQALPPALWEGPRSIRMGDSGNTLELPAYAPNKNGKLLSIPVPKALFGAADT